jgi:hypothetical protein
MALSGAPVEPKVRQRPLKQLQEHPRCAEVVTQRGVLRPLAAALAYRHDSGAQRELWLAEPQVGERASRPWAEQLRSRLSASRGSSWRRLSCAIPACTRLRICAGRRGTARSRGRPAAEYWPLVSSPRAMHTWAMWTMHWSHRRTACSFCRISLAASSTSSARSKASTLQSARTDVDAQYPSRACPSQRLLRQRRATPCVGCSPRPRCHSSSSRCECVPCADLPNSNQPDAQ